MAGRGEDLPEGEVLPRGGGKGLPRGRGANFLACSSKRTTFWPARILSFCMQRQNNTTETTQLIVFLLFTEMHSLSMLSSESRNSSSVGLSMLRLGCIMSAASSRGRMYERSSAGWGRTNIDSGYSEWAERWQFDHQTNPAGKSKWPATHFPKNGRRHQIWTSKEINKRGEGGRERGRKERTCEDHLIQYSLPTKHALRLFCMTSMHATNIPDQACSCGTIWVASLLNQHIPCKTDLFLLHVGRKQAHHVGPLTVQTIPMKIHLSP